MCFGLSSRNKNSSPCGSFTRSWSVLGWGLQWEGLKLGQDDHQMKCEHAVRGVCMRVAVLHSAQRRDGKKIRQSCRTAARILSRFKRSSAQCARAGSQRCYTRPTNDTCRSRELTCVWIASATIPQPHMHVLQGCVCFSRQKDCVRNQHTDDRAYMWSLHVGAYR